MWGISATLAKALFVQGATSPAALVLVRLVLSALLLLVALAVVRPDLLRVGRVDLLHGAVLGVAGMAMVQYTYFLTISLTGVAVAIFLQDLAPILVALYLLAIHRQVPQRRHLGALALVVPGAFLLLFGQDLHLRVSAAGLASGLASAAFLSFYTIWAQRRVHQVHPLSMLLYAFAFGAAFWAAVHWRDLAGVIQHAGDWPAYLFIASFGTVIPFALYFHGLKHVSATDATLALSLEPLAGGLSAAIALRERLTVSQAIGGALIFVALGVLSARSTRKEPRGGLDRGELAPASGGGGSERGFRH